MHQLTVRRSFNAMVVIPKVNQSTCIADLLSRMSGPNITGLALEKALAAFTTRHDTPRQQHASTYSKPPTQSKQTKKGNRKKKRKKNKQRLNKHTTPKKQNQPLLSYYINDAQCFSKHRQEQTLFFPDSGTISQRKKTKKAKKI